MADSIRRQLMHGQNHVVSPVFKKPCVTDAGSHACPRCMQRARIELLIKDGYYTVGGCRSRPFLIGLAATSGRSVSIRALSHKKPTGLVAESAFREPEGLSVVTASPVREHPSFPRLVATSLAA